MAELHGLWQVNLICQFGETVSVYYTQVDVTDSNSSFERLFKRMFATEIALYIG